MALSPETKAKIAETMRMRHAERAKNGTPWKGSGRKKKAGLTAAPSESSLVRQLEKEIEERQLLIKLLRERGVK